MATVKGLTIGERNSNKLNDLDEFHAANNNDDDEIPGMANINIQVQNQVAMKYQVWKNKIVKDMSLILILVLMMKMKMRMRMIITMTVGCLLLNKTRLKWKIEMTQIMMNPKNPMMVYKALAVGGQYIYTRMELMMSSNIHSVILIFLLKRLKFYIMTAKLKLN